MNNYFNAYQSCKLPEVNGMNGANAYQIGVNSSVLLLDTNLPIVYLKQTDGGGYATVSAFDLVPHKDTATKTIEDILDHALKNIIDECEDENKAEAMNVIYDFMKDIIADMEAPVLAKMKTFN